MKTNRKESEMKDRIKKYIKDNQQDIVEGVIVGVISGLIAVVLVQKKQMERMIDFDTVNAVIAEELDFVREHHPDVLMDKTMYLVLSKV